MGRFVRQNVNQYYTPLTAANGLFHKIMRHKTDRCLSSQKPKEAKRWEREGEKDQRKFWCGSRWLSELKSCSIKEKERERTKKKRASHLSCSDYSRAVQIFQVWNVSLFEYDLFRNSRKHPELLFNSETAELHDGKIAVKHVCVWCVFQL